MFKHIALFSTLISSALLLTGCAITPTSLSGIELQEPRPTTEQSSNAMKIASVIKTSVNCLGCNDTVLWADEKDFANKMVFDTKRNTRLAYAEVRAYQAEITRLRKAGQLTAETMPKPPRILLNPNQSSSGTLTNSLMIADSLDGRWTNSSASLGTGLALAAVGSLLSSVQDENLDYPPTDYVKAAFVLPPENKIVFENEIKNPKLTPERNHEINLGIYAGKQFVQMLTKRAIEMGFKPVGDLVVDFIGEPSPTNSSWTNIYQLLENDAIGCPKYDPKNPSWMGEFGYCRVEWGPYRPIGVREAYSWKIAKELVPSALGGDGKTTRWINHFGYNQDRYYPLNIVNSKLKFLDGLAFEHRFLMGLQKHLNPGQAIYIPTYKYYDEQDNAKWTPQVVLDSNGTHYFSVVVSQKSPAPATTTNPTVENKDTEKNNGMSAWINKLKTF